MEFIEYCRNESHQLSVVDEKLLKVLTILLCATKLIEFLFTDHASHLYNTSWFAIDFDLKFSLLIRMFSIPLLDILTNAYRNIYAFLLREILHIVVNK